MGKKLLIGAVMAFVGIMLVVSQDGAEGALGMVGVVLLIVGGVMGYSAATSMGSQMAEKALSKGKDKAS